VEADEAFEGRFELADEGEVAVLLESVGEDVAGEERSTVGG